MMTVDGLSYAPRIKMSSRRLARASAVALFVAIALSLENAAEANGDSLAALDDQSQRHDRKVKVMAVAADQVNNDYKSDIKYDRLSVSESNEDRSEALSQGQRVKDTRQGSSSTETAAFASMERYRDDEDHSADSAPVKQLPFFIADDGKSIQLPQSDVIYKETGEVLIRNRNSEKRSEDGDTTSSENIKAAVMKQNYFNIRPENLGFNNLQGFVIPDEERKFDKPVISTSESQENANEYRRIKMIKELNDFQEEESHTLSDEMDTEENMDTSTNVYSISYLDRNSNKYERTGKQSISEEFENELSRKIERPKSADDENGYLNSKEILANKEFAESVEEDKESIAERGRRKDKIVRHQDDDLVDDDYITTQPPNPLDALRGYLEDIYLRGPIAVVVDTEEKSLMMARDAWNAMERAGGILNLTDLILIAYEKDGITMMSHHKAGNPREVATEVESFKKVLNNLKASKENGKSYTALIKAYRILPYDSAIFLFSNKKGSEWAQNEENTLIRQLLSKRIKLYVICGSGGCEGSAARASGGSRVELQQLPQAQHIRMRKMQRRELRAMDVYYDGSEETNDGNVEFDDQESIALKTNLNGTHTIEFSVDSTIKTITLSITGNPENATLYTPTDESINILDEYSVTHFSEGSEILALHPTAAVRLMMHFKNNENPKIINWGTMNNDSSSEDNTTDDIADEENAISGKWKLIVKGSNLTTYDVQVDVESSIRMTAKIITQYSGPRAGKKNVKISVGGSLASVNEATIVDQHGKKIVPLSLYRYHEPYSENDVTDIQTLKMQEAGIVSKIVPIPSEVPKDREFFVQITGKNNRGEPFTRLSQELIVSSNDEDESEQIEEEFARISDRTAMNNNIEQGLDDIESDRSDNITPAGAPQITGFNGLPMTLIQIGTATRLHGTPGQQMQLHFEVTNNRENSVFFRFGAKDDQYFLRSMNPQQQWVNGGQTVNVVVNVGITSTAEHNVRDTVTFTATGLEQTTISAYIYVVTDSRINNDRSRPWLSYSYRGDCLGYLDTPECVKRNWGLDITARDTESGLLRISTSPNGLVYGSSFYGGSREEVYARYSASCCSPRVQISAVDLNGNAISYDLNVANYLTPTMIAAIVLGVLLFIALIIVAIILIRWMIRRKRVSRDIPSYQTQRAP